MTTLFYWGPRARWSDMKPRHKVRGLNDSFLGVGAQSDWLVGSVDCLHLSASNWIVSQLAVSSVTAVYVCGIIFQGHTPRNTTSGFQFHEWASQAIIMGYLGCGNCWWLLNPKTPIYWVYLRQHDERTKVELAVPNGSPSRVVFNKLKNSKISHYMNNYLLHFNNTPLWLLIIWPLEWSEA